jgi:hypothetical protein
MRRKISNNTKENRASILKGELMKKCKFKWFYNKNHLESLIVTSNKYSLYYLVIM